jgi:large subunit ribosomal protein L24
MKIKKGDKVKVIAGKDKGREGVVERVYSKSMKLVVPAVNIYKKHVKKNEKMPKGGVVEVPRPVAVAKVMLICSKCGKVTRIGYKIEGKKKLRICQKCESTI